MNDSSATKQPVSDGESAAGEEIVCAAIRAPNGKIFGRPRPERHHHIIREMSNLGYSADNVTDQGFWTNRDRFVSRKEGLRIAEAAGQITEKLGSPGLLFSEDMW